MGHTFVKAKIINPKSGKSKELEFLVDSGTTESVIPEEIATELELEYLGDEEVKIADGAAIEKGSFLKLTESMTAIITSGQNDKIAGIAAEEKIINDGKVTIPVYMGGIFKVVAGAAVSI